jgi:hypothetical protein
MKIYKDISFDLALGLTIDLDRLSSRPNNGYLFKVKQRSKLRGIRPNYLIQRGALPIGSAPLAYFSISG